MQLTMLALLAVAAIQLALNQRAMSNSAFMLRRAGTSYGQLEAYQQLSIDALEYIVADEPFVPERQKRIETQLNDLFGLVNFEVDLVEQNGGSETNLIEGRRLKTIQAMFSEMFAARTSGSNLLSIYRTRLRPLLDEAVNGERAETAIVERSMRQQRQSMLVLGGLGIFAQVAMAAAVLGVFQATVLGPLRRLVADIGEFGRGRLSHRVMVPRRDEFGLLAQHINRMARHLGYRTNALMDMNKVLETTVADRTRDLQKRNEELQEIDESRRRFFVDVSHELRTPLTAIVGEADITLRGKDTKLKAYREALSSILANSTYLNRRIDDLMALARSSSGRLDLEPRIIDLNLIATEAMDEVRSLAKINQVKVEFAPLTTPVLIEGDRLRLRQCLMILLDNAVKFSPADGSIEIRIKTDSEMARLSVTDEGRGIDAEELPVIFDRFYQTDVGRRRGGTGLGLAIARRIVDAHRGTINAARAEHGGATITIGLPLRENEET